MKAPFSSRLALVGLLLATGMTLVSRAEEKPHLLQNIRFDKPHRTLSIETQDKTPLKAESVSQHTQQKLIAFFLPKTALSTAMQTLKVTDDPMVQSIDLQPDKSGGQPGVWVKIHLTNAASLPFSMGPQPHGLSLIFPSLPQTNIQTATKPSPKKEEHPATPKAAQKPEIPKPDVHKSATTNTIPTFTGTVAEGIVQDVFYDENSLVVVSEHQPLTVKRSFMLNSPNRFVVDIAPASLASKELMRVIPQNNPNITSLRVGQPEKDTVRIVVLFKANPTPINITQDGDNHQLKLNF